MDDEKNERECVFSGMIECERLFYGKCTLPEEKECVKKVEKNKE